MASIAGKSGPLQLGEAMASDAGHTSERFGFRLGVENLICHAKVERGVRSGW